VGDECGRGKKRAIGVGRCLGKSGAGLAEGTAFAAVDVGGGGVAEHASAACVVVVVVDVVAAVVVDVVVAAVVVVGGVVKVGRWQ
jgi:hypothetical protein